MCDDDGCFGERVEDGHSIVLRLNRDEKSNSRRYAMMMDVMGSVNRVEDGHSIVLWLNRDCIYKTIYAIGSVLSKAKLVV